jgi:Stress responsive A/B Barrel Domain
MRPYNAVMIRNVVLVKLKPGQDAAAVAQIQEDLRNLDCPGMLSYTIGDDLGLREGNWSFAIVADLEDEDSCRAYDQDAEHNRIRARIAPMAEQIARAQFQVPLSRETGARQLLSGYCGRARLPGCSGVPGEQVWTSGRARGALWQWVPTLGAVTMTVAQ